MAKKSKKKSKSKKIMTDFIYNGDCLEYMKKLPDKCIDLIITDPPYNIGKRYKAEFNDNMKLEEYLEWCKKWLSECFRILKQGGSFYLFNYPRNNAYLMPFIDQHLEFKRWMTWHYPTNTGHSKTNFTRTQHSILFYSKGKPKTFNRDDIAVPYKNPTDKRIKELIKNGSKGRVPYDVFQFNIVKNVSKEKTPHVCQLPIELIKIFVKASSKPNEIVFDPFMGSGTTAVASKSLGRKYLGCEISKEYCKIIEERLSKTPKSLKSFEN